MELSFQTKVKLDSYFEETKKDLPDLRDEVDELYEWIQNLDCPNCGNELKQGHLTDINFTNDDSKGIGLLTDLGLSGDCYNCEKEMVFVPGEEGFYEKNL